MYDPPLRRIPLHLRETVGDAAPGSTALSAYCPDQVKSVGVESCARCASVAKIRAKKLDGFVECRAASELELAETELAVAPTPDLGERSARLHVGEVMNQTLLCVSPDTSVEALRVMLQKRALDYASIVDEGGRPIGIVAQTDLPLPHGAPRAVAEIMTSCGRSIREDSSLAYAFAMMALLNLRCVSVVSAEGNVVGLFTPSDALPWLTETYGDVSLTDAAHAKPPSTA